MKCENARCPSTSPSPKLFLCGGCSTVKYCSEKCQLASRTSHKQVCKLYPPPSSLSGIRLRVVRKQEDNVPLEEETEFSALKILELEILHIEGENLVKVGVIEIYVIDIPMMHRNGGFFRMPQRILSSKDLGQLALHFDHDGDLHPNRGCWQPKDFKKERFLVYLNQITFHLGRGVLNGAQYIFSWPTVLNNLEPIPINGIFGRLTAAENEAWLRKRERIIEFFARYDSGDVGFRRLANAQFFCLAKRSSHPSHLVAVEEDAPFEDLPPATTEDEEMRRDMAFQ
ncbi:hypothetical protein B0H14DRAFT_3060111 [Mycena olivaceomarginata]|nr:hypothetical protein B0H14DRAFT_3060111 [Mycena olivaceomarginata]